jgi:hypothetical protein
MEKETRATALGEEMGLAQNMEPDVVDRILDRLRRQTSAETHEP